MTDSQPYALYADVIVPLALPKNYTYAVPDELINEVAIGKRAEVSFGKKKIYAGLISRLHHDPPTDYAIKPLRTVLDAQPIVTSRHIQFWNWMAEYYMSTVGEVMLAALPSGLRLESETFLHLHPQFDGDISSLSAEEQRLVEYISHRLNARLADLLHQFPQKQLYSMIDSLMQRQIIVLSEQLRHRYGPRPHLGYVLNPQYSDSSKLSALIDELEQRAPRQMELLLHYLQISRKKGEVSFGWVERSRLLNKNLSPAALQALIDKKILLIEQREPEVSSGITDAATTFALSDAQQRCLQQLQQSLQKKTVTLLHGVTGSGKTHLYIRLIEQQLQRQNQVLYLLPEISLTAQMIARLRQSFGDKVEVYHSRLTARERVEVWRKILLGTCPIVLGARSALFLPWTRLGLVIVDEEHDASYKQDERAPYYHGRDAAIYLAHLFADRSCRVVLGSATPSLESYTHARNGKYGLVSLSERFGEAQLPQILLVDTRKARKEKKMHSLFTETLLQEIEHCLLQRQQVILFRNRRGYAPTFECDTCGWLARCPHCDVSLTYHKVRQQLHCHYCGHRRSPFTACPACASTRLTITGFGTQKVEEELALFFPKAVIGRLDHDTAAGKQRLQRIISSFEDGSIHILVGTQMITKGLDFGRVALVGVLDADQLFGFTDFRSMERGFQLMVQVSGRAGRRQQAGKVMLQTSRPEQAIYQYVMHHDYAGFYEAEIQRRRTVYFPPFCRLIQLTFAHRQLALAEEAARRIAAACATLSSVKVLGPAQPPVARIKNRYRVQLLLKLPHRQQVLTETKKFLTVQMQQLALHLQLRKVEVIADVDPL
ncbi:MAG: primosomal protein N' [Chitinophagales bacterium]|nr:primosomal protein N' [Chitinophagales bacterium]MDW8428579.1 primosomal protein N' [Chitinophagales bacterium]